MTGNRNKNTNPVKLRPRDPGKPNIQGERTGTLEQRPPIAKASTSWDDLFQKLSVLSLFRGRVTDLLAEEREVERQILYKESLIELHSDPQEEDKRKVLRGQIGYLMKKIQTLRDGVWPVLLPLLNRMAIFTTDYEVMIADLNYTMKYEDEPVLYHINRELEKTKVVFKEAGYIYHEVNTATVEMLEDFFQNELVILQSKAATTHEINIVEETTILPQVRINRVPVLHASEKDRLQDEDSVNDDLNEDQDMLEKYMEAEFSMTSDCEKAKLDFLQIWIVSTKRNLQSPFDRGKVSDNLQRDLDCNWTELYLYFNKNSQLNRIRDVAMFIIRTLRL